VILECFSDPNHEIEAFKTDRLTWCNLDQLQCLETTLATALVIASGATKVDLHDLDVKAEHSGIGLEQLKDLPMLTELGLTLPMSWHSDLPVQADYLFTKGVIIC
jgi:hypothetical protein